ncbi:MAG: UDP-glucose 4-epimerase GalE [Bryobacteraceae bacterium]
MARILVTGGAGYIGSHTVNLLIQKGHDPVVVDNLSRGHRHSVDARRLQVLDLTDTAALETLIRREGIQAVIHFAGYIAVGESVREPEMYFANNVGGSISLLTAMQRAGVGRLVFSSTAAYYGIPERIPIPEDAPAAPVNPYGESKVMVERLLGWLDRCRGVRSVCLRYFNACGADPHAGLGEEHDPETHLIPLLLRAVMTGNPVTVFGDDYDTPDGTCIRDYIHVCDLAEAHISALDYLLSDGPTAAFNVGTGKGYSVLDVIQAVEEATGKPVPRVIGPRREGDPPVLVADSTKLRHAFGWEPQSSDIRHIVTSAWEFEKRK